MIDLGTVVFQNWLQLFAFYTDPSHPEVHAKVKWFIECLCEAYGEKVDLKELKACIEWRRDFIKFVFFAII